MTKKIKFFLPDFYYLYDLNIFLIQLMSDHPEYFRDNIEIGAIYGTFPGAIWNGGRVVLGTTDFDNIKITIENLNNLGIPVRFTYTNCFLEDKHLNDTYCNLITSIAENGKNEILVNSPILEKYLRKNYPNYKYILSTTRCERNVDKINDACKQYDLVVIDYRDNNDIDFLNKLQYKDKVEILVNAYCNPKCTRRQEHYKNISECQLNFTSNFFNCTDMFNDFYDILKYDSVIKVEQLYADYVNMGFSNFKIEGRNIPELNVIESYVYYLVKPEYQNIVRFEMIKNNNIVK